MSLACVASFLRVRTVQFTHLSILLLPNALGGPWSRPSGCRDWLAAIKRDDGAVIRFDLAHQLLQADWLRPCWPACWGQTGYHHQPSSHHSPPLERPLATSTLVAPAHRAARLLELPLQPLSSMILLQTVHITPSSRQLLVYVARHLLADHVGLLAVQESLLSTWTAETALARLSQF